MEKKWKTLDKNTNPANCCRICTYFVTCNRLILITGFAGSPAPADGTTAFFLAEGGGGGVMVKLMDCSLCPSLRTHKKEMCFLCIPPLLIPG